MSSFGDDTFKTEVEMSNKGNGYKPKSNNIGKLNPPNVGSSVTPPTIEKIRGDLEKLLNSLSREEQRAFLDKYGFKYDFVDNNKEKKEIKKLQEDITDVIYAENEKAFAENLDAVCSSTEYLGTKIAEALYNAGYGKVEDYKKEIERLKEENIKLEKAYSDRFSKEELNQRIIFTKQQAIKEFSEKLKLAFKEHYNLSLAEGCIMIDDLLKEYTIGEE